ncbi:riboflavin synthase [Candidatus Peregrinibacteria bacterium]|nr:riboflavin synthase [Candidatus Peregrinibacteria bacterium]
MKMFTGIISALGTIDSMECKNDVFHLIVRVPKMARKLSLGKSISVDGVCLTVARKLPYGFMADVIRATFSQTTLSKKKKGDRVNLELPVTVSDALSGHIILGHVDEVGTLKKMKHHGKNRVLTFSFSRDLSKLVVLKGSIAVNGVSLTIQDRDSDTFSVALVPHTLKITNLGDLQAGDAVNLEADIFARYILGIFEKRDFVT